MDEDNAPTLTDVNMILNKYFSNDIKNVTRTKLDEIDDSNLTNKVRGKLENMKIDYMKIDKSLLSFDKCDVFTPDNISSKMASYLMGDGNLLDPAVGDGQLLKFIGNNYTNIDIYDIKNNYLDKCTTHPAHTTVNKHLTDFIKTDITTLYKNIILNPPYIRFQDLSVNYRNYIKQTWPILNKGNIDIYYAFLLKCLNLLADDGVMVSITPNSYIYNKSATELRKYFIENKLIKEIIDYKSEKVFDSVSTYCCITIFTKEPKEYLLYNSEEIRYSTINNKDYNIFVTTNSDTKVLSQICNVKNGIATLRDKIFVHAEKKYDEPCWTTITNSYKDMWVIYPYSTEGVIMAESTFKQENPLTYAYLEENKEELAKRDKGHKVYAEWYAFGRTQSLIKPKSKKVIYVSTLSNPDNIQYNLDDSKLHIGSLCIELRTTDYTLEQVKTILENNKSFIIQNTSKRAGGWLNMSSRILKQIPIE